MADLKACINLVSANASFPGCREDFPSEEAYREWRTAELANLQQSMLTMIKASPELVQSSADEPVSSLSTNSLSSVTEAGEAYIGNRTSRQFLLPEHFATSLSLASTPSTSSATSGRDTEEEAFLTPMTDPSGSSHLDSINPLVYIPPDVRQAYRRLLELMLDYDLTAMANLDPSEEVSLRILSTANSEFLAECVNRWRVMPTFRFVTFLEDMSRRYSAGDMPVIECVLEALGDYEGLDSQWRNDYWPDADRHTFLSTVSGLFDTFLRGFYETFSEQLPYDSVPPLFEALEFVRDNPLFGEAVPHDDLEERFSQLKAGVLRVSEFLYQRERDELLLHHPPGSIIAMIDLLGWLKSTTKRIEKNYRKPLLGAIDMTQLFLQNVPALYLHDLGQRLSTMEAKQQPAMLYSTPVDEAKVTESQDTLKDGEVMALYQGLRELTAMHDAFCPT